MTEATKQLTSDVPEAPHFAPDTVLNYSQPLVDGKLILDEIIEPCCPWSGRLSKGDVLTLVDVGANQSGDCLIYNDDNTDERFSVSDTIAWQRNVYVSTGTVLRTNLGRPLVTVVGNEVLHQDMIGGSCSKESNTLRYGHFTYYQHACRENFLYEELKYGMGLRDMVSNLNWFMNVPVEQDGTMGIVDGVSAPGKRVAFRAEMNARVFISNCPQMNNPCNDFNCTPLRVIVTQPEGVFTVPPTARL